MTLSLHPFRRPQLWLGSWLAMLGATLLLCLLPLPRIEVAVSHLDKFEHALGYAVLGAWGAMLFRAPRAALAVIAALVAFGVGIELLQAMLPWRSGDALDALANTLGATLGAAVALTPAHRWLCVLDARLA